MIVNQIKITMKYLKRLLGLPFFIGLQLVGMMFFLFKTIYFFMRYGGEAMSYISEEEPKMIADIYGEIVKQREDK